MNKRKISRLAELEYEFANDPEILSIEAMGELVRLLQQTIIEERKKSYTPSMAEDMGIEIYDERKKN